MNKSLIVFIFLFSNLILGQEKKPDALPVKKVKSVKANDISKSTKEDKSGTTEDKSDLSDLLDPEIIAELLKEIVADEKAADKTGKKKGNSFLDKLLKDLEEEEKKEEAKKKKKSEIGSSSTGTSQVFNVADPSQITETLNSVILNDSVRKYLDVIIKYFKHPEIFKKVGVECPKGLLLEGPPGTGKTSIGRALAKEAGCKFFYANGSEFDRKFVGEGANALRELFKVARENGPCIIFIDEIDTIAKSRTSEESRFHAQTAMQLMVEMDGFIKSESEKPVIVIATTNNKDHLDIATLRRFGVPLTIGNPDLEARKKILALYVSKINLSPNIKPYEINELAQKAEGFSGADIKNLVQQAALNAIMFNREIVEIEDLNVAYNKIREQKKSAKKANRKNHVPDYARQMLLNNDRFV